MKSEKLTDPFNQIFTDQAEADWAFDLLRDTAQRLGIQGAYDPRLALTLAHRPGRLGLHLNFGGWLVLGFYGPGRVDLTLLAGRIAWDERFDSFPFDRKEGEPEVRSYHLPLDLVRPMTEDLRAAFETTLDFIAQKFHPWKRAIHWKHNNPEIIESLFKPEQRERIFAGLLTESELRYERHFTAFYQDLSEEREEYETQAEEVVDLGEEDSPKRSSYMDMDMDKDTLLVAAFSQFRQNPQDSFLVKLRRKRAEQIRKLLSTSSVINVDTFNHEVWVIHNGIYWQGENISAIIDPSSKHSFSAEQIAKMGEALESGQLEIHGNCIWGSASRVYAPKLNDDTRKLENIRQAILFLNDPNLTPIQKAQQINEIYGFGNNVTTGLVMLFHPNEFGLYNELGKQILKNLGYDTSKDFSSYQEILHQLKNKLKADDFIELDWFLYLVNHGKYSITRPGGMLVEVASTPSSFIPQPSSLPYPLAQLAEDTGFDEAELTRWRRAIERKGQIILYGPPGTGKTFVAEKLAQYLTGESDGFWELVQFHPAYAYEDFIQGIRPQSQGDHLTYPVVPGRFMDFCARAAARRGPCVLILDEINRANLSRVLGELMYLLEYRHREISLAGGGLLQIPANVRLIGTMNTADRSIALVDHALRRRFAFIGLYPNYELLRRYHQREQTGFPVEPLITTLQKLNHTIGDRHYEVGVSFFLRPNLAEEIEDIWRMEIEPYLEEYFFDRPDAVAEFGWNKIKSVFSED